MTREDANGCQGEEQHQEIRGEDSHEWVGGWELFARRWVGMGEAFPGYSGLQDKCQRCDAPRQGLLGAQGSVCMVNRGCECENIEGASQEVS